jgi:hypothetical protein
LIENVNIEKIGIVTRPSNCVTTGLKVGGVGSLVPRHASGSGDTATIVGIRVVAVAAEEEVAVVDTPTEVLIPVVATEVDTIIKILDRLLPTRIQLQHPRLPHCHHSKSPRK